MRWLSRRRLRKCFDSFYQKKAYRIRAISVISVTFSLLFYVIFYLFLSDNYIIDYQYVGAVDQSVLEGRVDFREMAIAKMCSNTTSVCYGVYDRRITQGGEEEIVERHLLVEGFSDESESIVRLIPPKGENFETSDTRIWAIDHSDIRTDYVAGMLVVPFLLTTLSLDLQNIGKTVLEIGLGGGSFSMAMHKLEPDVNITVVEIDPTVVTIAREWFDVTSSENHHIIIDDGLEFIKNSVAKSLKFDVVVLDACDKAIKSPCPRKYFRNTGILTQMKNILTTTGCLIVNVLSSDGERSGSSAQEIVGLFTSVFPTCIQMRIYEGVNVVLSCVPYRITDVQEQMKFYNIQLARIVSQMGLNDVLGHAVLV